MQQFQWYPGHMTKAKRAMQADIKLVDLVIELVDARVPLASRNPDIDRLSQNKSRIIILNKSDLASDEWNKQWAQYFKDKGYHVMMMDARSKSNMKSINAVIANACQEKMERDRKRGILNRPVRAMVAGIPNVGKSTFINSLAGKSAAKTGNKPGVTRGNQWIKLHKNVELLDTPGILWPKFEDQMVGLRLALIGSIKDDILNISELAVHLIEILSEYYPGQLEKRYEGIQITDDKYQVISEIARIRKCLLKGGELNLDKAASLLMDDFRSGRLGRITLEFPEN